MLAPAVRTPQLRHTAGSQIRHKQKYSVRAFYLCVLLISAIAVVSLLLDITAQHARIPGHASDSRRGLAVLEELQGMRPRRLSKKDQECRLVHNALDKCAFIRANCPDEEAGFISYLSLYYCRLHHVKPIAFIILVLWLGLLFSTIGIAASDFFCINLSTIAGILGMSESMAGVTFLAFGNGSPDVFSTFAAMSTHSGSLAVGELIGAAGFITAVVAGSMALVRPFKVARKSFVRDVGFFIVAASFSMVFLADGSLHLWECAVMVGFYIFYVVTVVLWHWWLGRRRRRRERDAAARGHFYIPGSEELEAEEQIEDDEDGAAGEQRGLLRGNSTEDFLALEHGGSPRSRAMDEDEEEENRERWLAELSSNMRVSRPARGERRNTVTPIRPSLVGALEFRAVLSSLQKSRNMQTIPINLRRYSDDPSYTTAQQQDQLSNVSDPEVGSSYEVDPPGLLGASVDPSRPNLGSDRNLTHHRVRAVSANDAVGLRLDRSALDRGAGPGIDLLSESPQSMEGLRAPGFDREQTTNASSTPQSPSFSLSPPGSGQSSRQASPAPPLQRRPSPDLLAPPQEGFPGFQSRHQSPLGTPLNVSDSAAATPPKNPGRVPRIKIPLSRTASGSSIPTSKYPPYKDYPESATSVSRPPSIRLPPPSVSPESMYVQELDDDVEEKPIPWWPYKILPPPQILASTLFPTLYSWHDKNIWEKFLGIIAAPSVFLLAITLPVAEGQKDDDEFEDPLLQESRIQTPIAVDEHPRSVITSPIQSGSSAQRGLERNLPSAISPGKPGNGVLAGNGFGGHGTSASVAAHGEDLHHHSSHHSHHVTSSSTSNQGHEQPSAPPSSPKDWNRWLVAVQTFTAPFFVVVIVWANSSADPLHPRTLIRPTLYSLLASLVVLAVLLFTTTPSEPPRWRFLLCFLGFVVAIAWISTIANEVVGVLKAFGVILGISDAILGLTIFAVGNSLGDLVADITVARLGYPVMALSACFGGPMLNILLGVGLSGLYMTIKGGNHRYKKHPDRPITYKPYEIEVSSTLMISAVTLLVTLLGLLIVVPLNKWRMDRRIGWFLIGLWCVSTVGNLVVEITGFGESIS
ncbi:MAG: hypothetical protein M1836_004533 [Candelina mexicana]|nr:MAG: hypothetical protein M1836_004533 [Candelina mexicana]